MENQQAILKAKQEIAIIKRDTRWHRIEKPQAILKAKQEIARAMLVLHNLKGASSPSGHKQLAAIIVELSVTRDKLDKVEK